MDIQQPRGAVYLIPSALGSTGAEVVPPYVLHSILQCHCFYVENIRTARRYLKSICPPLIVENYEWVVIEPTNTHQSGRLRVLLLQNKHIGVLSEAGCPGIADPGNTVVALAHQVGAVVKPLVGASSIVLALMASGFNGQHFQFWGYLPIHTAEQGQKLRALESESFKTNCTQLFIETPYRNNQLLKNILSVCKNTTMLCVAANLTNTNEWIKTQSIALWKTTPIELHKVPAIFLLYAGV